jgi:large subunit ribosomal protein L28
VVYPKEADEGLWGGEGVVKGFLKYRKFYGHYTPKYWFPTLLKTTVYSEILDKYLKVVVTKRTLRLIDDAYGFDHYILNTPVQDLRSQLGLNLRRMMLVALVKRDFHLNDPQKRDMVYNKFKQYEVPLEEAEWFGLTTAQAITRQKVIEAYQNQTQPLKIKFAAELVEKLKELKEKGELPAPEETESWMEKIKDPFRKLVK